MANSTITLFLSTSLHEEKRFAIEHIDQWLLGFTATEVKKFQYIKNQLNLSIKINMSQDGLEASSANDIDYVSITNSNETKVYYYFVVNKIWKSTETIEFVLKMDTLNTFEFDVDYIVDKKTLVHREHKDRIIRTNNLIPVWAETNEATLEAVREFFDFEEELPNEFDKKFIVFAEDIQNTDQEFNLFTDNVDPFYNQIFVDIYNENNVIVYSYSCTEIGRNMYGRLNLVYDGGSTSYDPYDGSFAYITIRLKQTGGAVNGNHTGNYYYLRWFTKEVSFVPMFKRKIDKYPENINPVLFKKSEEMLLDKDENENWYLVYANENAVVEDEASSVQGLYVNPVKIMFAKDAAYHIAAGSESRKIISPESFPQIPNAGEELFVPYNKITVGAYIEINSVQYTLSPTLGDSNYNSVTILKRYNNDNTFYKVFLHKLDAQGNITARQEFSNVNFVVFYGVNSGWMGQWYEFEYWQFSWKQAIGSNSTLYRIGSDAQTTAHDSTPFEDMDLTLSKLIKIIQLPYAPLEFLSGIGTITSFPNELVWNVDFDLLEIVPDKRFDFSWQINFEFTSPFNDLWGTKNLSSKIKQARDDYLESKFYNSEFTQNKFVYDSFVFNFDLELIDINEFFNMDYRRFYVNYGVSKRLSSKFYFQFEQYVCGSNERQDYNNVLVINRNNEIPLYTNAYINYMRTGYQFDVANKNNQQVSKWAGIALSTVGAIASFVSSPATGAVGIAGGIGLTTSTIGQVIGAIATQNQQENSIAQKMLQSSLQSESVQGSDDVELFKQYGQNKAKLVKYQPSEVMSKMIKDLFYYGGYATSEYKIPAIDTRVYFNYLQCDLVLNDTKNLPEPILEDIINKFKEGATIFHKFNGEWDIEQQYENYEVSI